MTDEQLAAITERAGRAYTTTITTHGLAVTNMSWINQPGPIDDVRALLAEIERLREHNEQLGHVAVVLQDKAAQLQQQIEQWQLVSDVPALRAEVNQLRADRDHARTVAECVYEDYANAVEYVRQSWHSTAGSDGWKLGGTE